MQYQDFPDDNLQVLYLVNSIKSISVVSWTRSLRDIGYLFLALANITLLERDLCQYDWAKNFDIGRLPECTKWHMTYPYKREVVRVSHREQKKKWTVNRDKDSSEAVTCQAMHLASRAERGKQLSLQASRWNVVLLALEFHLVIWILDFWPPELWKNTSYSFKLLSF